MNKVKRVIKFIGAITVGYLVVDFAGFLAWLISGQTPQGWHLGGVTAWVVKLII